MTPRIGSACSGYGGLEMGLMAVAGGSVVWHVEYDKHPSAVLEARFPGVPNYGDVTTTDWTQVEPVDIFCAGYPCQPFSHAGKRKGSSDERHLWPAIARAIGVLRPGCVLLENVRGHVSLGLDAVLGDLTGLGYDAIWGLVPAYAAGAPHERFRLFIVATDARRGPFTRAAATRNGLSVVAQRGYEPAADTGRERHGRGQDGRSLGRVDREDAGEARKRQRLRPVTGDTSAATPTHTAGNGRDEGRPEPARQLWRSDAPIRCDADCSINRDWRTTDGDDYGPAIRRWHDLTRCVPEPTEPHVEGRRRLSPRFTEWMQGLPAGHVTDILPRNPALKALGNGVVPQQAALAIAVLMQRAEVAA